MQIFKDRQQLDLLRRVAHQRGLIVFTDSDGAGFVIRNYGQKIIIAGASDAALLVAADYFIKNYLDVVGGKTKMPKDLFYVSSNGLFLSGRWI
mgnify:CR=1 FL=1